MSFFSYPKVTATLQTLIRLKAKNLLRFFHSSVADRVASITRSDELVMLHEHTLPANQAQFFMLEGTWPSEPSDRQNPRVRLTAG